MSEIKVVIADDQEMVRKGIRSWLEAEDGITVIAEVRCCGDIPAAVTSCAPDVLLIDLHPPDTHCLDVIRELRAGGNATPILVMTSYRKQRIRAVFEAGANGYFEKEESRGRIVEAVRWAASREEGKWLSPSAVANLLRDDSELNKAGLTQTEMRVLALIELHNAEIAAKLFLAEGTVKNHISSIYSKLNLNRMSAAAWARKHGFIEV